MCFLWGVFFFFYTVIYTIYKERTAAIKKRGGDKRPSNINDEPYAAASMLCVQLQSTAKKMEKGTGFHCVGILATGTMCCADSMLLRLPECLRRHMEAEANLPRVQGNPTTPGGLLGTVVAGRGDGYPEPASPRGHGQKAAPRVSGV